MVTTSFAVYLAMSQFLNATVMAKTVVNDIYISAKGQKNGKVISVVLNE